MTLSPRPRPSSVFKKLRLLFCKDDFQIVHDTLLNMNAADSTLLFLLIAVFVFFSFLVGAFLYAGRGDPTFFERNPLSGFWTQQNFTALRPKDFDLIKVQEVKNNITLSIAFQREDDTTLALLDGGIGKPDSTLTIEEKTFKIHYPQNKSFRPTTSIYCFETGSHLWEVTRDPSTEGTVRAQSPSLKIQWELSNFGSEIPFFGVSQFRAWRDQNHELIALKYCPFKFRNSNVHILAIKRGPRPAPKGAPFCLV